MTTYGFLSTFPPTQCGLATFTTALMHALIRPGLDEARVVRSVEQPEPESSPVVVGHLVAGDRRSLTSAVELLSACDVVIAQHEYGIYGGPDGDEVVAVLEALRVPTITVLHTVLTAPTPRQRAVLEAVVSASDAVVTMALTPRRRLGAGYDVDMAKVEVIPHGAEQLPTRRPARSPGRAPTVLTWGLIGPGKGIEWGIDAMALLRDIEPTPRYLVVGGTHPKVRRTHGESYRNALMERARGHGVEDMVSLMDRYVDDATLAGLIASADVVLLPYDSTDQVTSGVLVEAVAACVPVVATAFPHARELLHGGAGLVVRQGDAVAMAGALRAVLTRPALAADIRAAAGRTAPTLWWPAVGDRYRELAAAVGSRSGALQRWEA